MLDRFHITMHLNQAVDQVRRAESGRLRGRPLAERLKHMRWQLLRRGSRVRGHARRKLDASAGQQTGDRSGLDSQGILPILLALQVLYLGRRLSGLLVPRGPCAAASSR